MVVGGEGWMKSDGRVRVCVCLHVYVCSCFSKNQMCLDCVLVCRGCVCVCTFTEPLPLRGELVFLIHVSFLVWICPL